jgi:hypothetical protein
MYISKVVKDSERIPESAKPDFLKSIEEADLHGLMSFVVDGKIVSMDDEAKVSLEQRFEESPWAKVVQEAGSESSK